MMDHPAVQHALGFVGVVLAYSLSWAPLRAVRGARACGNLGGLDPRSWALFFFMNAVWMLYSLFIGDVWLFLATSVPMAMWLWFCFTAVRLMSQEEGELSPQLGLTWEAHLLEFHDLHAVSAEVRRRGIDRTERSVVLGLLAASLLGFLLAPASLAGLEAQVRLAALSFVAGGSSLACWLIPVSRLWQVVLRRDASTIFLPLALAQAVMCSAWAAYGMIIRSWALAVPNCVGTVCAVLQLALRLALGGEGDAEGVAVEPTVPAPGGAKEAWTVAQQQSSGSTYSSTRSITPIRASTEELKYVLDSMEAQCDDGRAPKLRRWSSEDSTSIAGTPRNLPQSPLSRSWSSASSASTPTGGTPRALKWASSTAVSDLPDLTGRLKEQGIYMDYLKWQREYMRWRQGNAKGATGELHSIAIGQPTLPSVPDQEELGA